MSQEIGIEISNEDKNKISDFLYKSIVIKRGQTDLDQFQYDKSNIERLSADINNLKEILVEAEGYFGGVDTVPDTISDRDEHGNVIYPYKVQAGKQSPVFREMKKRLGPRLTDYLVPGWQGRDFHEEISVFLPNVVLGDMKDIVKLSDNQIDVELAVRSTVYTRGDDYVEFVKNLVKKLSDGGVAIDDSIRDNDGWYYRVAEILRAKQESEDRVEVLVVLGPGFPGEDKRQDKVPLSMLLTKNGSSLELAQRHLPSGHELIRIEDLAEDDDYLRSLDDSGLTMQRAAEVARQDQSEYRQESAA